MDRRQHVDASPTERTLAEVRSRGWYASPCEAWKRAGARCVSCDLVWDLFVDGQTRAANVVQVRFPRLRGRDRTTGHDLDPDDCARQPRDARSQDLAGAPGA